MVVVAPATAVAGAATTTTPDPRARRGGGRGAGRRGGGRGPGVRDDRKGTAFGKSHTTPGKRRHRWHSQRVIPVVSDDGRVTDTVHAFF